MQKQPSSPMDTLRHVALCVLDAVTLKRIFLALIALVFLPAVLGAIAWSVPIILGLVFSSPSEGLALSFLELLAYAGLIYAAVYAVRAYLRRRHQGL